MGGPHPSGGSVETAQIGRRRLSSLGAKGGKWRVRRVRGAGGREQWRAARHARLLGGRTTQTVPRRTRSASAKTPAAATPALTPSTKPPPAPKDLEKTKKSTVAFPEKREKKLKNPIYFTR